MQTTPPTRSRELWCPTETYRESSILYFEVILWMVCLALQNIVLVPIKFKSIRNGFYSEIKLEARRGDVDNEEGSSIQGRTAGL
eukprot:784471-Amorphochlora_amoeboformis.AAC.1